MGPVLMKFSDVQFLNISDIFKNGLGMVAVFTRVPAIAYATTAGDFKTMYVGQVKDQWLNYNKVATNYVSVRFLTTTAINV